jgi:hypothetical protein
MGEGIMDIVKIKAGAELRVFRTGKEVQAAIEA